MTGQKQASIKMPTTCGQNHRFHYPQKRENILYSLTDRGKPKHVGDWLGGLNTLIKRGLGCILTEVISQLKEHKPACPSGNPRVRAEETENLVRAMDRANI